MKQMKSYYLYLTHSLPPDLQFQCFILVSFTLCVLAHFSEDVFFLLSFCINSVYSWRLLGLNDKHHSSFQIPSNTDKFKMVSRAIFFFVFVCFLFLKQLLLMAWNGYYFDNLPVFFLWDVYNINFVSNLWNIGDVCQNFIHYTFGQFSLVQVRRGRVGCREQVLVEVPWLLSQTTACCLCQEPFLKLKLWHCAFCLP